MINLGTRFVLTKSNTKTMKKIILSALTASMSLLSIAQPIVGSNLTVFSEDGNKFFLILNGERQNNNPQTNIRVEDLTQAWYSCKIIFEDKTLGELSKNNLPVRDVDNVPQEVVYKIKTDKNNGKLSLRYFSAEAVRPDFIPPSNVQVYHYGNPAPVVVATPSSQTTVQTTTTNVNTGTNVNVNMGGFGVNVNVNDPLFNETTTTTTTTTTSAGTTTPAPSRPPGQPAPRPNMYGDCGYQYQMNADDFTAALETIKETSFDETKLTTAKQIVSANCMTSDQVLAVCKLFSFEASKLDFAKFAYDHTTDRRNFFKVNNVFSFSSSKEELSKHITNFR